jgi:uncharacterized membrane protein YtjA (UPF0391 family)
VFLMVGLITGAMNFTGVSAVAVQISWILSLVGIVLVAIHVFKGRPPGVMQREAVRSSDDLSV